MSYARYAIYFGPRPGSELHNFGLEWLGTDPETGRDTNWRPLPGFTPESHSDLVSAPRRYALHGTLKPPFRLADGRDFDGLRRATERLSGRSQSIVLPPPVLKRLGGFMALCPTEPSQALAQLAASCVMELDDFRAPAPAAELDRRRASGLTARQDDYLTEWGYPYVLEDFRFHVTLTRRLDPQEADRIEPALRERLRPVLEQPLHIDDLCIYGEPSDGAPFRIVDRFALQSAA
ncbi:DUF1045 domain-containing protein [Pacificispira sp.]|uniref:DUF1045 domain-containing protein n=1 Tax=Pacificispira sp. TaxID=2888761 RepID=UPI003B51A5F1